MSGSATPRTNAVRPNTGRPSASSTVATGSRSSHSPPSVGAAAGVAGALELAGALEMLAGTLKVGGAAFGEDLPQPTSPTSASPLSASPANLGAAIRTGLTVAAGTEQAREANLPGLCPNQPQRPA